MISEKGYDVFKEKIERLLKGKPEGLTWSQIKERLNLPQHVPNNKWVRMMERDIRLVRERSATKGMIWRLPPET